MYKCFSTSTSRADPMHGQTPKSSKFVFPYASCCCALPQLPVVLPGLRGCIGIGHRFHPRLELCICQLLQHLTYVPRINGLPELRLIFRTIGNPHTNALKKPNILAGPIRRKTVLQKQYLPTTRMLLLEEGHENFSSP